MLCYCGTDVEAGDVKPDMVSC